MNADRLAFALERLRSGDWSRFEQFASHFLVHDHGSIRTVASGSGDRGRDAELFSPDGEPNVLIQYSVTADWKNKIKATAKRLKETFPSAILLVYATNQLIGAKADEIKKQLLKDYKLVVDIRDRNWFTERMHLSQDRVIISESLAAEIVDPYLASRDVVESKVLALSEFECKAAVLHLQLQWEDDIREKGLTKLSFEALVKSVLRETSPENRIKRRQIHESIHAILPQHDSTVINGYIDSALKRLERQVIKRWLAEDEFCLSHEEVLKVRDRMAQKEIQDETLLRNIRKAVSEFFDTPISNRDEEQLSNRAKRILETFLMKKGEEFASAVAQNRSFSMADDALEIAVTNDFANTPDSSGLGGQAVNAVRLALVEVLQRSGKEVQIYLREIADGYTLFGFLRAVPDVQTAVQKVFCNGEVWLDTSILLPVLAETLLDPEEQLISKLLRAGLTAGIKFRVTSGVIEELERHINRCLTYARTIDGSWVGRVPFLYAMFALSGNTGSFEYWADNFCGRQRPEDDIIDYLHEVWNIDLYDLQAEVESTDKTFRWEVERIWREAHTARRNQGIIEFDDTVIDKLVRHDVECHLGVLAKRDKDVSGQLGYAHWWLTFDKTTRILDQKLRENVGDNAPKVPVMSPDFLAGYIAVGPVRHSVSKATEASVPVALFDVLYDQVPAELLEIANAVRQQSGGVNERVLRRKLRDTLDLIKRKEGKISKEGFAGIREKIEQALRND